MKSLITLFIIISLNIKSFSNPIIQEISCGEYIGNLSFINDNNNVYGILFPGSLKKKFYRVEGLIPFIISRSLKRYYKVKFLIKNNQNKIISNIELIEPGIIPESDEEALHLLKSSACSN
jgi:hypothetical protein